MKKGLICLLLLSGARVGFAQAGGSAGANSRENPAQTERDKREIGAAESKDDGTSTFIEASVLMNVKADEYVAVFGVIEEAKTPEEVSAKMDATIASFKSSLKTLGISGDDLFVDFVTQNRIYGFQVTATTAKEELAGFELKKNVSIHFKDKLLIDKLVVAAAQSRIFDLIKVDYLVKDLAAIQATLQTQTMGILKQKAERYQTVLGVKLSAPTQVLADKPSVYFPVEQYDSYTASESENIGLPYDRNRITLQNARKSRTTFFNPLSGDGFDVVVNPIIIEPVVQFTTYMKVKCEAEKSRKK